MKYIVILFLTFEFCLLTSQPQAQNVGIGTDTPKARMHIRGNADTSQLVIDADTSQTTPLIRLRSGKGEDVLHIYTDTMFNAFYGINAGMNNRLPQGLYNTFIGSNAGVMNTRGISNTAVGRAAFYNNKIGEENTAVGYHSLFLNTGDQNTAVGSEALYNNTSGEKNVAVGRWALKSNATGDENTALGNYALQNNASGFYNTASGRGALFANVSGSANTAYGAIALSFNSASNNTAVGYRALYNSNGSAAASNTAIGFDALINNTTGNNNIALGAGSGSASGYGHIYNTISIGNYNFLNAYQNQAFFGNLNIAYNGGNVTWSTFSDGRIKTGITEDVKGLEFILKLRPVTYFRNTKAALEITGNTDNTDNPQKNEIEKIRFTGFIAQEVEAAAKQCRYDFSGVHKPHNEKELYSLSYESFVVPLVKAVQEQQQQLDAKQKKIDALEARLQKLEALLLKN